MTFQANQQQRCFEPVLQSVVATHFKNSLTHRAKFHNSLLVELMYITGRHCADLRYTRLDWQCIRTTATLFITTHII